jgi:hypothetical protein
MELRPDVAFAKMRTDFAKCQRALDWIEEREESFANYINMERGFMSLKKPVILQGSITNLSRSNENCQLSQYTGNIAEIFIKIREATGFGAAH